VPFTVTSKPALVLALAGLVGCGNEPAPSAGTAGTPSGSVAGSSGSPAAGSGGASAGSGATGGMGLPGGGMAGSAAGTGGGLAGGGGTPPDTSGELYDPETVPRFDIELPEASVAALGQAPDVYVTGTLRYGAEVVSNIGVRIKGEASQRTLEEKAAFKLKFDEFVDKQSFHGLRRMTFNNMVEDPSFLAERLAYHFFRAVDLPAPRANHAVLYVNGALFGLYVNIETEDKTFLRRWFDSDEGNLYEEGQVDFEPGNEAKFDLETNETANDRSDLTALIAAIGAASPATYVEDVGAQLDMPHFLKFTAAEAAVNQWDMYAYTVFYPNNFRIYRSPTPQKFVFLPWGMDMSMKPFRDSGKPFIQMLELARVGDFQNGQISAGRIFRNCLSSPGCEAAYVSAGLDMADRYEQAGLLELAKKYFAQVEVQIEADPRKEYSMNEVQTAYQSLLDTIEGRAQAMRESLQD
jgi:hypothetical protein